MTISIWSKLLMAPIAGAIGLMVCHDVCHAYVPWDPNWDNREFLYQSSSSYTNASKRRVHRNIFLVRHGHYFHNEDGLSFLGKQQAEIVGQRFQELSFCYESIYYSGLLKRGKETSEIIARFIPGIETIPCGALHKGDPIAPVPTGNWVPLTPEQLMEDGCRIEKAFRKYFFRPDPEQTQNSYEIIVLPSNVIRYFVCRLMQFPPEAWGRFSLHNCSITWVRIHKDGKVSLHSVGDFGHIPTHKITPWV